MKIDHDKALAIATDAINRAYRNGFQYGVGAAVLALTGVLFLWSLFK